MALLGCPRFGAIGVPVHTHEAAAVQAGVITPKSYDYSFHAKTSSDDETDPCEGFRVEFNTCGYFLAHCLETQLTHSDVGISVFKYAEDRLIYLAMLDNAFNIATILQHIDQISDDDLLRVLSMDSYEKNFGFLVPVRTKLRSSCGKRIQHLGIAYANCRDIDDIVDHCRERTVAYDAHKVMYSCDTDLESARLPSCEVLSSIVQKSNSLLASASREVKSVFENMADYLYHIQHCSEKLPLPFAALNTCLDGGLSGGTLTSLASPPSGGKTTFSSQIADFMALNGIPALIISMEMPESDLITRGISRMKGIYCRCLESGIEVLKEHEGIIAPAVLQYTETVSQNLYIIQGNPSSTSPAQILSYVRQIRAKKAWPEERPVFVVVDYAQLLSSGDKTLDNSTDEVTKQTRIVTDLKSVAVEGNIAMLAISEVTKEETAKSSKESGMSINALRGTSRFAFISDYILLLYSSKAGDGADLKDPWTYLAGEKTGDTAFTTKLDAMREKYPAGGSACVAYSVIELAKNRRGINDVKIPLIYQKAYHRFFEI